VNVRVAQPGRRLEALPLDVFGAVDIEKDRRRVIFVDVAAQPLQEMPKRRLFEPIELRRPCRERPIRHARPDVRILNRAF
jgi:hypothetical protein